MQRIRAATAHLALVSTSPSLVEAVVSLLTDDTTLVSAHGDLDELLASLPGAMPDVVVIDDAEGHDAALQIRLLRRREPSLCVAFVGVRDEARGISLLDLGADDAVINGSSTLGARLRSAARRARTMNARSRIAVGDIVFDREARRVWCAGREVSFTPHEYDVINCMFWHAPKAVGVDTLADFVWGGVDSSNRRTLVQVYMSYVRKKLAKSMSVAIRFSRGVGYEFSPRNGDA
jgi:DNA-binding response OmpR family regulator